MMSLKPPIRGDRLLAEEEIEPFLNQIRGRLGNARGQLRVGRWDVFYREIETSMNQLELILESIEAWQPSEERARAEARLAPAVADGGDDDR